MSAQSNAARDTIPAQARPGPGEELMADATRTIEHARERAGDLYRQVKDHAVEKEHEFEDYVKEHPVKSVLIAAGVGAGIGLLAGALLSRR